MKSEKKKKPRLEDLIPDEQKRAEVVSRLYKGDPLIGDGGIFTDMLQAMVNAALEGELDSSLQSSESNRRNGHNRKVIRSNAGPLEIVTPRDRNGDHEPILIKKWERELGSGLDEVILSLYARGQSIDDVRYQLRQLYGVEVSSGTISAVTERIWSEVLSWQQRELPSCFSVIYLDAIHYKVREDGRFQSKAIYTCYDITKKDKNEFGYYPKIDRLSNNKDRVNVLFSKALINKNDGSMFAVLYDKIPLLRIFTKDGELRKELLLKNGQNSPLAYLNEKLNESELNELTLNYLKVKATNNFIYGLYSGKTHAELRTSERRVSDYGYYIHVWDWDGNPIAEYELPDPVFGFAVTNDDKHVFCSSLLEDDKLYMFDLTH